MSGGRGGGRSGAGHAPTYSFWLLITFLVLEYLRPPGIVQLKLQMLILLVLPALWLFSPVRPWSRVLTAQVAFLGWCAKSIPLAHNYYSVYVVTRHMYGHVAIAIALTWICSNRRELSAVIWTWVAMMTLQAVYAITHGGVGMGGMLGDENDLALACGTAFPFAFVGFERFRGRARWLCGAAMLLLVAAIVVSFSRGGFLGLVVAAAYCLLTSRNKPRSLGLLLVALLAIPALAPDKYIDEIKSISRTSEGTAMGRRFLWTAAYNMWKAHPVLGVGGGNASHLMGRYQPTDFEGRDYTERNWTGQAVHSMYFQLLAEQGAPGTLIFGFLIWSHFSILRRLRLQVRRARDVPNSLRRDTELYALGLNGALLGLLSSGAFLSVPYYPYVWYFTALAAALDIAVRRELSAGAEPFPSRGRPLVEQASASVPGA